MSEPPKSTYPIKMHGAVLRGIESAGTPGDILTVNGAPFYSQEYLDKAIEAERGEIAEALEKIKIEFLSPSYASNQPFGSITERFAIDECIREVRNRSNTTTERNEG